MKKILIPLPNTDFDPTETAVPWKYLKDSGFDVIFATPLGEKPEADYRMVTGRTLGVLAGVLKAAKDALSDYADLQKDAAFMRPLSYADLRMKDFDCLLLPGGHAPGMKVYLESAVLQELTANFFDAPKPVGAICHGVVLAARSKSKSGRSVLYGKKTTALLKSQEMLAWNLTRLWLKDYYRTYPQTVQDEVISCLENKEDFIEGPMPVSRDTLAHPEKGFIVRDGNYLSARWPGDAHRFAIELAKMIQGR